MTSHGARGVSASASVRGMRTIAEPGLSLGKSMLKKCAQCTASGRSAIPWPISGHQASIHLVSQLQVLAPSFRCSRDKHMTNGYQPRPLHRKVVAKVQGARDSVAALLI